MIGSKFVPLRCTVLYVADRGVCQSRLMDRFDLEGMLNIRIASSYSFPRRLPRINNLPGQCVELSYSVARGGGG